jgi:crotonobetainyl-CoA:carnitine CoA-transferase CaiB-like acyl-CoA transferase
MTLPLAGYRVLELAHLIAGPMCGMYLADGRQRREDRARLEAHDVLCAPVNRYADLPTDPPVIASGMVV